ncbi:hypothetical protein QBC46DRAFT_336080 [Diplogelasinospora grovesii]|uniref:Developmental regulatory protein wetA n=1 Tax=Diplogelasinospora grovesii TaxID=303347 RepID=A0AAN6NLN0_9PEZI|nr:hypothetical protein QBC46DRAFT_336080 [Diplogelasinospora grovesii]
MTGAGAGAFSPLSEDKENGRNATAFLNWQCLGQSQGDSVRDEDNEADEESAAAAFFEQYVALNGDDDSASASNLTAGEYTANNITHFSEAATGPVGIMSPLISSHQIPPGMMPLASAGTVSTRSQNKCTNSPSKARFPQPQQHHTHHPRHWHNSQQGLGIRRLSNTTNPHHYPKPVPYISNGQRRVAPPVACYTNSPSVSGVSILDSELLKLEGLSMHGSSPSRLAPQHLSSSSVPNRSRPQSTSPRKASRLGAIYSKIRDKAAATLPTLQGKSRQQAPSPRVISSMKAVPQLSIAMSTAKMESSATTNTRDTGRLTKPHHRLNLALRAHPHMHLPLTPPLTGSGTQLPTMNGDDSNNDGGQIYFSHDGSNSSQSSSSNNSSYSDDRMEFVNALLGDPFLDAEAHGVLAPPAQISGNAAMPNTPLHTPLGSGMSSATTAADADAIHAASADWHHFVNDDHDDKSQSQNMWGCFGPATTSAADGTPDAWWDDGSGGIDIDAMDTDDMDVGYQLAINHFQGEQQHEQVKHQQHQGFERLPKTESGTEMAMEDFAAGGLMIHMPQPRTPTTAVLQHHSTFTTATASFKHHEVSQSQIRQIQQQYQPSLPPPQPQNHRRHKPRAPSSGARYLRHPDSAGNLTASPRKMRNVGGGGSGSRSLPSPTPAGSSSNRSASGRQHRRSASMQTLRSTAAASAPNPGGEVVGASIRKRKSWTGRRGSNGEPTGDAVPRKLHKSASSSFASTASTSNNTSGNGGGGMEVDFVVFTPQDHTTLMTGVAPSGSSKTKARREREAAERQRKLSEHVLKAVAAAGGDVRKLKEDGIMAFP